MFEVLSEQRKAHRNIPDIPPYTNYTMTKIKTSAENKCWQGCAERGTQLHYWWDGKPDLVLGEGKGLKP